MEKSLIIKKLLIAFGIFVTIPLGNLSHLFDPIFDSIQYGQETKQFNYVFQVIYYIVMIVVAFVVIKKLLNRNIFIGDEKSKEELSLKRTITLYLLVLIPILIISAICGWTFKPLYDLGDRCTGLEMRLIFMRYLITILCYVLMLMIMILTQEVFEDLIKTKYPIPYGGIIFILTFGIYQLFLGISSFYGIYLLFGLLYGYLYLLSNRNFKRTFIMMVILFLL